MDFKYCKLEIFIPETHISQLQKALQSVDAGHIGNYDSCMSCSKVTSYWRPLDGTSPYIGNVGEISCEPEVKVEVVELADSAVILRAWLWAADQTDATALKFALNRSVKNRFDAENIEFAYPHITITK